MRVSAPKAVVKVRPPASHTNSREMSRAPTFEAAMVTGRSAFSRPQMRAEQLQTLVQPAGEVERIEDFAARVAFQGLPQGRGIVHPDHRHRPYGDGFQGYFRGGGCRIRTRENTCRHRRAQADARAFEQAKKPLVFHAVHIVFSGRGEGIHSSTGVSFPQR